MRVSDKFMDADSVEEFVDHISILSVAGAGVIHARTDEVSRALTVLRENLIRAGHVYREWNVLDGMKEFDIANYRDPLTVNGNQGLDFSDEFEAPLRALRTTPNIIAENDNAESEPFTYYVYVGPQFWLDNNPVVTQALITYGEILPTTTTRIILVTPDAPLPEDIESHMTTVRMSVPGISELMKSLNYLLASSSVEEEALFGHELSDADKHRICYAGAGLSKSDFELYTSWAIASTVYHAGEEDDYIDVDAVIKGISRGKTEIVSRSDILELIPSADIAEVGGMDLLKSWIYERRNCFTDEAAEFGISPPKGIVCTGIPGSGKSLISKAIAGVFGVPVVRLDFGRVFNAYVGRSEERVRKALEMAQAMAPCVLFCVRGDTELTLADGAMVTAEGLYERHHSANESFTLQGVSPNTGELQPLPLRTIIRTQGKPMVRIETESGRSIEVTTDHRLLVKRGDSLVWVQVSELEEGDDLLEIDP